jgi:hypothetical protein
MEWIATIVNWFIDKRIFKTDQLTSSRCMLPTFHNRKLPVKGNEPHTKITPDFSS